MAPQPADIFRRLRLDLPQPWSTRLGRLAYLPRLAAGDNGTRVAFAEESLIERLVADGSPLEHVGRGLSERVVEIPWVLRALPKGPNTRVLDVGTAFAPVVYKRLLIRQPQQIETVDMAKTDLPRIPGHLADVRELPFADRSYDVATCISTLEHIGMDNAHYRIPSGGDADVQALREMGRVAGRVLVTVPGGADADFVGWRQYAPSTFRARAREAGLGVHRLEVFVHDAATGWAETDAEAITGLQFGDGVVAAAAVICAELG